MHFRGFDREIRPNHTGDDVQQLQVLLNLNFGTLLIEDGIYGRKTIEIVKQIQTKRNLPVTGICDRQTLRVIENEKNCDEDWNENLDNHRTFNTRQRKSLQFLILAMPLLIMLFFLWKPDLINLIFRKNGLGIIFFVSCMFWALLIIDKITGVEVSSQVLTELIRYLRDFLQLNNQ